MNSLAILSLKRPITAVMFFISLMVVGVIASQRLAIELLPNFNVPFVMVELPYVGANPTEMEESIIRPVEGALATLPGIKRMNSQSGSDAGRVFLEFSDWDRDIAITASEARERLDAIRDQLPDDFQRYYVFKFSPSDQPILRFRFAGDVDLRHDYNLVKRAVADRLERLPGVAKTEISGVEANEVEIAINPDRMTAQGVVFAQLAEKLQRANFSISGGNINNGRERLRVKPVGELTSLDQLRDMPINERGTKVRDVATVTLQQGKSTFGRRLDGKPAVGLDVFRERDANLVDVVSRVQAELDQIIQQPEFEGTQLKYLENQADAVSSSLQELLKSGFVGAMLSLLVLFFFLRHWPSTLMVTLAIPVCIIITLGAMYFFGLTLNVLTMMGLLLGLGMLVDNSVVVVESIYQQREKYPDDPVRCAVEGTRGVQLAISAGTLTSIIVFAPMVFSSAGQLTIFLGQVAITITLALLTSWLVAVSLIPMISARLKTPPAMRSQDGFMGRLMRVYEAILNWSLNHRAWSLIIIGVIALTSFVPAKKLDAELFKNESGREVELFFNWNGSYSLEQVSAETKRFEDFLDARREEFQITQIYSWFSERGWGGMMLTLEPPNPSVLDRLLLRKTQPGLLSAEEVQEKIRKELPKSTMAEIGFERRFGPGGGGGEDRGIQVRLSGDSMDVLLELGEQVSQVLSGNSALRDVRIDIDDATEELVVRVDRDRAKAYGFSTQQVASFIGMAIRGRPLREFRHEEVEVPVTLRFEGADEFQVDDLKSLTLKNEQGVDVPLMSLVNVSMREGPSQIHRQDRQTSLNLKANPAEGRSMDEIKDEIESAMEGMSLPAGYTWSLGGGFEQDSDLNRVVFDLLLAFVLIYIIMASLFESYVYPAAILSCVIFSFFGVFWLFMFTGTTFTFMAFIGMLVLMGVVVNNGIVMVEHINAMRRNGYMRREALIAGSKERLRPVLMTMATTVLGMLPLSVGSVQVGGDGPAYYPMARAVVGGLMFSTVVTLLFLPTIYATLDDMRKWWSRQWKRAASNQSATHAMSLDG